MSAEVIRVDFGRRQIVRREPAWCLWDDVGQDPVLDAAIRARIAELNAEIDSNTKRFNMIRPEGAQ